jgi:PAS domain S-box-containing protein
MSSTREGHAIVLAEPSGNIRYWSAGAEEFFGYSAEAAVGQSRDLIVPEEYRERHWAGFRRVMSTGECRLDRATTNLPVRCADATVRVFPGRFVFLSDARNEVVGVMALYSAPAGTEQPFGPIQPLDDRSTGERP